MKIDQNTLKKIAHLARLELDEATNESMLQDLNQILDWVAKLDELDTDGVEPLSHMTEEINQWRKDEAHDRLDKEKALQLAPRHDQDYFRVPKVIDISEEQDSE